MSYVEKTEDSEMSVDELASLITDTLTCCMKNYEALQSFLAQKEAKFKIYNELVQVNVLLKKVNEELVRLRVEFVTDSPYERNRENVLSEGDRKRRTSGLSETDSHVAKRVKTEPFSIHSKCSFRLSPETEINMQSENMVLMGTKETMHSQLQTVIMNRVKNIKTEIEDSNDFELPEGNSDFSVTQKSCDTTNNAATIHFSGDEKSVCTADALVWGTACDKGAADTVTQIGNNEEYVLLQNAESGTTDQKTHEDSGSDLSDDLVEISIGNKKSPAASVSSDKESTVLEVERANSCPMKYEKCDAPAQSVAEDKVYGVIRLDNGRYKCTLCDHEVDDIHVNNHVNRSKHRRNQIIAMYGGDICLGNRTYTCILCNCNLFDYYTVTHHVQGKKHQKKKQSAISGVSGPARTEEKCRIKQKANKNKKCAAKKHQVPNNISGSTKSVSVCSDSSCSRPDTIPSNSGESTASVPVHPVMPCTLPYKVVIVEENHELTTQKHAVTLDNLWTYFRAPFHINKKFFGFNTAQLMCFICHKNIGKRVRNVKDHISESSHLNRINILQNILLENMLLENESLLDIPNSLKNIVPTTEFSLTDNGFFCRVCNCFTENTVVLSHMTGSRHGKNLAMQGKKAKKKKKKISRANTDNSTDMKKN